MSEVSSASPWLDYYIILPQLKAIDFWYDVMTSLDTFY